MRPVARMQRGFDPFQMLRSDIDQLFDDFMGGGAFPALRAMRAGQMPTMMLTPQIDISETDREVQIAAELPGMSADDIEVRLDDGVLTIHGEKRSERKNDKQEYHLAERSYGTFSRYVRLPFSVDPEQVQATFKDGVLTVVVPKPGDVQRKSNKIDVKAADTNSSPSSSSAAASGEPTEAPPASSNNTGSSQAAAA
jgi:HSP20 family protein